MDRSRSLCGVAAAALLSSLLIAACSSTQTANETPREQETEDAGAPLDGTAPPAPDDAGDGGCTVSPVPDAVRKSFKLAAFYTRYVGVGPFPVVSSSKVPDDALCAARDVIVNMLEERPELLDRLAEKKIRFAMMAESEVTTDIPEHATLHPKEYWDERARGLGPSLLRPAVSGAEENALCYPHDRYVGESIVLHEFAHAVFEIAIELYEPEMRTKLDAAFASAEAAGLFANTYAMTNANEYWAEGVQSWFDTNRTSEPPDGIHNEIHTRAQLKAYDPDLAALIEQVFGDRTWRYSCPEGADRATE